MWIFADRLTGYSAGSHNQTKGNDTIFVPTTDLEDPDCSGSSTLDLNLTGLPEQANPAHANPFTGNN